MHTNAKIWMGIEINGYEQEQTNCSNINVQLFEILRASHMGDALFYLLLRNLKGLHVVAYDLQLLLQLYDLTARS